MWGAGGWAGKEEQQLSGMRWRNWAGEPQHTMYSQRGMDYCCVLGTDRKVEEGMLEADPALVNKCVTDEYEETALEGPQFARELVDVKGLRGYARDAEVVQSRLGMSETAVRAITLDDEVAIAAK